jgi:soluble lytic murein transglycosylase-like protein
MGFCESKPVEVSGTGGRQAVCRGSWGSGLPPLALRIVCAAALAMALGNAGRAQDSRAGPEQSLEKQRASLEKQRAAVRAQVRSAEQDRDAFFTAPWAAPLEPLTPAGPPDLECEPIPQEQLEPFLEEIARRDAMTPDLLRAVIEKESSYVPCAVSPHGAEGLMQLMPETAAELGVADPFDPRENIDAGSRYLKQLLDRYGGNLAMALAAYNAGPRRIDSGAGLPQETVDYLKSFSGFFVNPIAPPLPIGQGVGTSMGSPTEIALPPPK